MTFIHSPLKEENEPNIAFNVVIVIAILNVFFTVFCVF